MLWPNKGSIFPQRQCWHRILQSRLRRLEKSIRSSSQAYWRFQMKWYLRNWATEAGAKFYKQSLKANLVEDELLSTEILYAWSVRYNWINLVQGRRDVVAYYSAQWDIGDFSLVLSRTGKKKSPPNMVALEKKRLLHRFDNGCLECSRRHFSSVSEISRPGRAAD